jgi:hypothetical protein
VTINTKGTGIITFNTNANTVRSNSTQKYTGNVVVSGATTTLDASTGNITFDNDFSGSSNLSKNLTLTTSGLISFGSIGQSATGSPGAIQNILITGSNPSGFTSGAITAQSFKTDTGTKIAGNVSITGAQF